jgi:xylulokinase
MINCVLGVDIGTTSLKVGLFTEKGEVVSLIVELFHNPDSSFIANEWLPSLKNSIKKIKKEIDFSLYKLIAISVSGNGPTVVSENGRTFIWNENLPDDLIIPESCKNSLFLPRILSFKKLYPKEYEESSRIYSSYEFLIYKLTGNSFTIMPEKRFIMAYWNEQQLKDCGILEDKMPPYKEIAQLCGNVSSEVNEYLGIKEADLPVFSAGSDFVAAMIGTNTLEKGKLCERSGSSEGFNFCIDKTIFSENARTLPSVISGLWNLAILKKETGRKFLKLKQMVESSKNSTISYQKLYDDSCSGEIQEGFEILQAILNDINSSYQTLKSILHKNGINEPSEIVITGGQAKNSAWIQKRADTLGVKIVVKNCEDAELVGNVCCALTGMGLFDNIKKAADEIVQTRKVYYPSCKI